MDNKEDWKKLEQYMENRNAEMLSKYKIDINQDIGKRAEQTARNRKIIKRVSIIIAIILILGTVYNIYNIWASGRRKGILQQHLESVTETKEQTNIFGNGCYSYKTANIPDIEIHACFNAFKDRFIYDSYARVCKYYFEKWEDSEKEKFIVSESYDDCRGFFYKKKNWILNYKVYIEVNSYEEAEEAIETIIRFKKYAGNADIFGVYIKAKDKMIGGQVVGGQKISEMREYMKKRCLEIFENEE